MRLTKKLKALVVEEATNLRKFAKKKEIKRLNFERLDASHLNLCIYGQMTGNCFSVRAKDLMSKCTIPYSMNLKKFAGTKRKEFARWRLVEVSFSPIEYLIANSDIYSESLINFIKGKTETIF